MRPPGLSAAVYTQTTDVEVECNGFLTYDREMVKPTYKADRAANMGVPPAGHQRAGVSFRSTFREPTGGLYAGKPGSPGPRAADEAPDR